MTNLDQAKKAAKEHGVKGFRKLKLKREVYIVGKQCQQVNEHIAKRLIGRMEEIGFHVEGKQTLIELAEKGLFDTMTIAA